LICPVNRTLEVCREEQKYETEQKQARKEVRYMAQNNEVKLVGNVGNEPEQRATKTGKMVTTFRIAVDTFKGDEERTKDAPMWVTIVTWEALAETVAKTIKKGNFVKIVGRLRIRKYTDKNQIEREAVEVVAQTVTPIKKKEEMGKETITA
jgi:single-strand DNA-binding protein